MARAEKDAHPGPGAGIRARAIWNGVSRNDNCPYSDFSLETRFSSGVASFSPMAALAPSRATADERSDAVPDSDTGGSDPSGPPALLAVGTHGSGRTSLLRDLAGQDADWWRGTGLESLSDADDLHPLRDALGLPLDEATADEIVRVLAGSGLIVEDAQWIGKRGREALCALVGRVPLLVSVALEHSRTDGAVTEFLRAGFVPVPVPELAPGAARGLARSAGTAEADVPGVLEMSGGNPALLLAGTGPLPATAEAGLRARAQAIGPAGRQLVLALHRAGGVAAVDADDAVLADLLRLGLIRRSGPVVLLRQRWLGRILAEDFTGDDAGRASPDPERAATTGIDPSTVDDPLIRAEAAVARCASEAPDASPPGVGASDAETAGVGPAAARPPVAGHREGGPDRAIALLAAGRPHRALSLARTADTPLARAVAVGALRQSGRAAEALDLAGTVGVGTDPDLVREWAALTEWPGAPPGTEAPAAAHPLPERPLRLPDWDGIVRDAAARTGALLVAGDLTGATAAAGQARQALADAPSGPWHDTAELLVGVVAQHAEGPSARLQQVLEPLAGADFPGRTVAVAHLALALADRGRASDALAVIDGAGTRPPVGADDAVLQWATGEVQLVAGRPRMALREALRPLHASVPPPVRAVLAPLVALVAARAAADVGEPIPPARPRTDTGVAATGWDTEHLALTLRQSDPARAAREFDGAAELWPSQRATLRCRLAAADARLAIGDADAAIDSLRNLETTCIARELLPLLAQVHLVMRRAGLVRRATGHGAGTLLSGREQQVMELVCQGLPSSQIAARLGVAQSTVDTQIASAVRKLGAATRRQAMVLYRRSIDQHPGAPRDPATPVGVA